MIAKLQFFSQIAFKTELKSKKVEKRFQYMG